MLNFKREFIMCAAIYVNDGEEHVHQPHNIKTGYCLYGPKHAHCIATSYILNPSHKASDMHNSGFVTSLYRYVDREEGARIAYAAGQIPNPKDILFSEDLIYDVIKDKEHV